MSEIHQHPLVENLAIFYGDLLFEIDSYNSIKDHLSALAARMYEGVQQKHASVLQEINNYHKDYLGRSHEDILALNLSPEGCKKGIANAYSFDDWGVVESLGSRHYDLEFEKAVNNVLSGQIDALELQLRQRPDLVQGRSNYGHEATLLHYCGSNGVEMWRQKVPYNLVEITKLLLDHGADKRATMKIYDGNFDPLAMLTTSVHPYEAGVGKEMEAILR